MLAVGGWSQCQSMQSGVFSHASAKISMRKVGGLDATHARKARASATQMTRELRRAVNPQPHMTYCLCEQSGTHPSSRADSSTQDTSPQNAHNASAFSIVTTPPPIKSQHPPKHSPLFLQLPPSPPSKPYAGLDRTAHAVPHSLATDAIGGSTPT